MAVRLLDDGISPINCLRFTNDGNYCMTAGDDRTIRLWNPHKDSPDAAGKALLVKSYGGSHGYSILDIKISNDNSKFVSGGVDKSMFVWDVTSGRVVRRIQGHAQKINALEMNSDSSILLSASYDQTVSIWDLRNNMRDPIQSLTDFKDSVTSLATTECCIIAGCIDGCLRTYDIRKGLLQVDRFNDEAITCVRTTHDKMCTVNMCMHAVTRSNMASILGLDGIKSNSSSAVRLVDLASGSLLRSYSGHIHTTYKSECCVAHDDKHVLGGSEDGSVHIWDIITGRTVATMAKCHSHAVSSLSCHPTLPLLLSAGYDGKSKLWKWNEDG